MRRSLKDALKQNRLLIGDGGMGTELQRAGLEPGGCGDEWNLLHPERVLAIQRRYVEAGSQLLITNTFGTNRFVLGRYELQDRLGEIARAGARIARQAIGEDGWVLGDVGPCGGFLEPLGEISAQELEASLRETINGLLEADVDAIILETITALDELEFGIRIARELGAPCVIASLAYDKVRDGYRTMMGVTPEQASQTAIAAGADVLGANCGARLQPEEFAEIARRYRVAAGNLSIMLQPNAGQPRLEGTAIVYPTTPQDFAASLSKLVPLGNIIGGCCGSNPDHIRAFAACVRGAGAARA